LSSNLEAKIIICIPAFNEAKAISEIILRSKKYANEVLVYDDGSKDDTCEVATAAGATVIRNQENLGYGVAIRSLFQTAKEQSADIMITLDSDGQHNPDQIPHLIEQIRQGFDIVIGSRFLRKDDKEKVPKFRSFGIRTITKLTQTGASGKITDSQSGFRAYSKNTLSKINLFQDGMAVSTEILLRASEKKLSTTEVPITINYDIEDPSTHNPITHGVGVLYSVFQYFSLRHPMGILWTSGHCSTRSCSFLYEKCPGLFSETEYVSTNMILIAVGIAVVGVVLLATGAILYTLIAYFKGRMKY
jgi:glycosyltransferase involved in cell wall biosynthesis